MSETESPAPVAEGTEPSLPAEAVAPPAAETPAEQPPQQPGESDAAHRRRLIEAARIEKRARAERQAAERARAEAAQQAQQIEQFRQQYAEMQRRLEQFEGKRKNALRDPKGVLAELGLDLDTIVRAHIDEGPTPDVLMRDLESRSKSEVEQIKQELQKLREEQAAKEQRAQAAEAERAAFALRAEIQSVIQSDPDKYELTASLGQESEVFELMRLAYQQQGTILPVAQAADMIENFLLDQAKQAARAKKVAALFQPQAPTAPTQAGKPATQAKSASDAREPKASVTLTDKLATSPAQPAEVDDLGREEALEVIARKVAAKRAEKRAANAK